MSENYNYWGSGRPNGWPRQGNNWLHSDMKDMAYFFVYKLYEQISTKGNIKDETH